jgi:hypothetical protein
VSGLAALCISLLSATNSQDRWISSRATQQQLEAEQFLYLQSAGNYSALDEAAKVRLFSERIAEIWSNAQESWAKGVSRISNQ